MNFAQYIFPAAIVAVCSFAEAITAFDISERYIREAQRVAESADAVIERDEYSFHRKINLVLKLQAAAYRAIAHTCPRTNFLYKVPSMDAFANPYVMVDELFDCNDELARYIRGCGALFHREDAEEEISLRKSSKLR